MTIPKLITKIRPPLKILFCSFVHFILTLISFFCAKSNVTLIVHSPFFHREFPYASLLFIRTFKCLRTVKKLPYKSDSHSHQKTDRKQITVHTVYQERNDVIQRY